MRDPSNISSAHGHPQGADGGATSRRRTPLPSDAAYAPLPRYIPIPLHETDIDALIRMRLLKEDQRQDVEALQTAVLGLLYRAEDDLA